MKGFIVAAMTTFAILSSSLAVAGVGHDEGKTTCYILKNNKLSQKGSCNYEVTMGSASTYGFTQYSFSMKGYKSIQASNELVFKTDKQGEPILNKSGSPIMLPNAISLNNKKAKTLYRYSNGLKVVSDQQTKKFETTTPKGVLSCMQTLDKSFEICAPFTDVSFGGV